MKRVIGVALTGLFLLGNVPAHAEEERGAWVAVDTNGNAVGQAIVCTPSVCGDANGLYSKLTLNTGEHYVLQSKALSDGNVVGVGANQGMDFVKVDLQSGVWTTQQTNYAIDAITQKPLLDPITNQKIPTDIVIQQFTSNYAPWIVRESLTISTITSPVITAQEQQIAQMYQQLEKLRVGLKAKKKKGRR
jgi:hypothetical protein